MPPTLPPQARAASSLLDRLHARLASHQATYMSETGKYWQGIAMDLDVANVDLSRRPTDQPNDWRWAADFPFVRLSALIRVDVYEGPAGWGYLTTAEIPGDQGSWVKALAEGPETWRTINDWTWVEEYIT